ncbi:MAG: hypothetical protein BroJett014_18840 [Planctomycetota bacterium]|nr:MAG: hypothetical protein BroJett014_18840 [Planctomycetota bacterium]
MSLVVSASSHMNSLQVQCPCGWRELVPAGAGGLTLECPRCGRNLKLPQSATPAENASDIALVERLTGRRFQTPSLRPVIQLAALSCGLTLPLGALLLWLSTPGTAISVGLFGPLWLLSLWISERGIAAFLKGSESA